VLKNDGFHGLHASQFMESRVNPKTQPKHWRGVFCRMPADFACKREHRVRLMSVDPERPSVVR
jgi:hypothetical protein